MSTIIHYNINLRSVLFRELGMKHYIRIYVRLRYTANSGPVASVTDLYLRIIINHYPSARGRFRRLRE